VVGALGRPLIRTSFSPLSEKKKPLLRSFSTPFWRGAPFFVSSSESGLPPMSLRFRAFSKRSKFFIPSPLSPTLPPIFCPRASLSTLSTRLWFLPDLSPPRTPSAPLYLSLCSAELPLISPPHFPLFLSAAVCTVRLFSFFFEPQGAAPFQGLSFIPPPL